MESLDAIEARARPAWERVVGLIGYFDLDPNRALDIILDVFSTHLATHHSFFVAFLSFSPWILHPKRSIKRRGEETMAVEPDVDRFRGKSLDEVLSLAEDPSGVLGAATLPPSSQGSNSRVLAQVLGFKFSHYQVRDVSHWSSMLLTLAQFTEASETTPKNLYLMAAILIREGFISPEDLYPHVSVSGSLVLSSSQFIISVLQITPADDRMADWHNDYLANVESRIAGAKISQLAMAAPLESGTGTKTRSSAAPEPTKASGLSKVPNQKVGLLNALLAVGALRPAVAILSKSPWVVDAFPEIADLMIRVLKHSVSSLYDSTINAKEKSHSFTQARARFGSTGVIPAPERRPHLTLWAPTPPSTSAVDFVFFFPDWVERVPVCSSLDDLVDVIEPLMHFVGLHVSRDPSYLTKFLRLGRVHLAQTVCEILGCVYVKYIQSYLIGECRP